MGKGVPKSHHFAVCDSCGERTSEWAYYGSKVYCYPNCYDEFADAPEGRKKKDAVDDFNTLLRKVKV